MLKYTNNKNRDGWAYIDLLRLPFCRKFRMRDFELILLHFGSNFTEVYSWGYNWQWQPHFRLWLGYKQTISHYLKHQWPLFMNSSLNSNGLTDLIVLIALSSKIIPVVCYWLRLILQMDIRTLPINILFPQCAVNHYTGAIHVWS